MIVSPNKQNANDWFTTEKIDSDTYVISEYRHPEETHCYLLVGSERALMIDTGLGVGNIYDEVKGLTDKPVSAVATHIHWDHIGGHRYFREFYVHKAELEWVRGGFPLPVENVRKMLAQGELPSGFVLDEYTIFQGTPARVLSDGDTIDLGGREIETLHTPGHSPGHVCFWEKRRGYLFTGDLAYKGTLFADYPSTDPAAYLASLEKIAQLPAERIFPAHHSLDIAPEIVLRMRDELRILNSNGSLCHGSGTFDFGDWAVRL